MQREIDDQLREANYHAVARRSIHEAMVIGTGIVKGPMVIGRKGHPLSSPAIAELARYPWIVPSRGTPLRKAWERMFAGIEPQPRVPIECGSAMVIRQLLIGSDFLTLLSPDQVAVELEAEWLAMLAETPPDLTRVIGITCRAGWRPTAVQSCFIRILRQQAG
jgi:DNA-binding transcriptional LysR family regulator